MKIGYILSAAALGVALASGEPSVPLKTDEGFLVPQPGSQLSFPDANGAHPQYKIEWWYLTGHLISKSGKRFGYQATFFRSGLKPADSITESPFGNQQAYLTHMAITDQHGKRFLFQERLARDSWDAYARTGGLDVRNGDWQLMSSFNKPGIMHLRGSIRAEAAFDLHLEPAKPIVRFGQDGTSRKGPAQTARSYYLSYTRLATNGTLHIGGDTYQVTGSSWMDHEIASSQLDPSYTGWDWIAIQLKDGWEVKAYLLRKSDGSPSEFSALIWIGPEGELIYRQADEFTWAKKTTWTSDTTGHTYPNQPQIQTNHPLTGNAVTFQFAPILDQQELVFPGSTYWEGAGDILDASNGVVGSAYLELVGYGGPIRGLE